MHSATVHKRNTKSATHNSRFAQPAQQHDYDVEDTPTANRLAVQSVLVHAVWFPILSSGIRGVATIHCLRKHPNSVSALDTAAIRTRTVSYSLISLHWHEHLGCSQLE